MIELKLKDVISGANRAHLRFLNWPDWKKNLSESSFSKFTKQVNNNILKINVENIHNINYEDIIKYLEYFDETDILTNKIYFHNTYEDGGFEILFGKNKHSSFKEVVFIVNGNYMYIYSYNYYFLMCAYFCVG